MTPVLVSILTLLLFLVYKIVKKKYTYWDGKVPCPKPTLILGNYGDYLLTKKFFGGVAQDLLKQYPNQPYIGTYFGTEPALLVQDPELIKLIMTKDFYYFNGRELTAHTNKEMLTENMFFTYGDRWRVLRQNLTPLFSAAKMKNMFHLIENCTGQLEKMMEVETKMSDVLDVMTIGNRYTMDCIGSCVFGVDTNTMGKNYQDNPFTHIGEILFENSSTWRSIRINFRAIWPSIFYGLKLKVFSKVLDPFFYKLIIGVFESRSYTPTSRNDFIDLLLAFKKNKHLVGDSISSMKGDPKKVELEVDDGLLLGQCILLYGAGFETSAVTLSFTLYHLAKDEETQARALADADAYWSNHDKVEYDCTTDLPYLEACLSETLRLYPSLAVITREVMEDYTLPTGLKLEKGLRIFLPTYHTHHRADLFPEPETYRPERFLGKEAAEIKPYTYFPFGEGPRICIGMRFGKMQTLAGLVTILKNYRVEFADSTPANIFLEPRAMVTQPRGGLNLKFIRR